MDSLNEMINVLRAIEDSQLITKKQILREFEVDEAQLDKLLADSDFPTSMKFAGKVYWPREYVELVVDSLQELYQ